MIYYTIGWWLLQESKISNIYNMFRDTFYNIIKLINENIKKGQQARCYIITLNIIHN